MMQIFVKSLNGKSIPLQSKSTDTIDVIKAKMQDQEGLPAHHQKLFFSGKQLEDGKTLSEYKIEKDCTVQLSLVLKGGGGENMVLEVKTLTGRTTKIEAGASDSIDALKELIRENEGLPIRNQRLIYNTKTLENGRALFDYGIQNGAIIYVIVIGPGG